MKKLKIALLLAIGIFIVSCNLFTNNLKESHDPIVCDSIVCDSIVCDSIVCDSIVCDSIVCDSVVCFKNI